MTVGIVLVSHSVLLAEGTAELASQMAPDVLIIPAGGTDEGRLGTSAELVRAALAKAVGESQGVVVLADLGSAGMTVATVLETEPDWAAQVYVAMAPFVEGAVAAAVTAQSEGAFDEVKQAVMAAGLGYEAVPPDLDDPRVDDAGGVGRPEQAGPPSSAGAPGLAGAPSGVGTTGLAGAPGQAGAPVATGSDAPQTSKIAVLRNALGLHARPAAFLARAVADTGVAITIDGVDGASVLMLLTLGAVGGDALTISGSGPGAEGAVRRIARLVESGFGEA